MKRSLLLLPLLLTTACNGLMKTQDNSDNTISDPMLAYKDFYFSGEYVYYTDAAVLTDCATGQILPIASIGDNLNAERRYTAMAGDDMQPCYATLEGYLRPRDPETENSPAELVITHFGRFDPTRQCNPQQRLTGRYVGSSADTATQRIILELHSDYSYKQTIHNIATDSYHVTEGYWGRLSKSVMVMMLPEGNDLLATIDWQGPRLIFSGNSIYTKTH